MQNRPSQDPRDQALRAPLNDAAALAAILTNEFSVTYRGSDRAEYLRVLGSFVADLDGHLDEQSAGIVAVFGQRRIRLRFL